jgi:hypothetical protein
VPADKVSAMRLDVGKWRYLTATVGGGWVLAQGHGGGNGIGTHGRVCGCGAVLCWCMREKHEKGMGVYFTRRKRPLTPFPIHNYRKLISSIP